MGSSNKMDEKNKLAGKAENTKQTAVEEGVEREAGVFSEEIEVKKRRVIDVQLPVQNQSKERIRKTGLELSLRVEGCLDNVSPQSRRWAAAVRRADKALNKLQNSGYESAEFLQTVLHSLDELLAKGEIEDASWSSDAYKKATRALQMARKSRRLKHLMITKDLTKADASCLLLRRAVLELEAVLGSLTWVDLDKVENLDSVRERVTEAIVSVLSAEMHSEMGRS